MPAEKPHMNLVFIGHVDHGKSTTVGRILFDKGDVPAHILEKYKKEAAEKGKATFEYAWVMDQLKEERERGLTIDIAHRKFITDKFYFTIIDAPGHRDFVKNMITGTSQADAAVLVVSAYEGPQEQTKEHIFLAMTLGVRQLVVALNKMDAVNYDKAKYESVKEEVSKLLRNVGYKVEDIPFIPISAYAGDNVTKKTEKMPWFGGGCLLDTLNSYLKPPEPQTDKPLRLPIQDVYGIKGIGTVPVGRVEYGILKKEMKVIFMPSGKLAKVKDIEMHHEKIPEGRPGDNVGFSIDLPKEEIHRGEVAGPVENPPMVAKSFKARIIVLNHPSVITAGYTPVFHCHTSQIACVFEELIQKVDPKTGAVQTEKPEFLSPGDAAIVKITPTRPMVIEKASDFPHLGRFAIRDMGQTVAAGMCIEVEKKEIT
jgi:elongation factor 1-alpha